MVILDYLLQHPEAVVIFVAMGTFIVTWRRDQAIQRRQNYLKLEFESISLFRFCSQNPSVPLYLNGKLKDVDEMVMEATYWFVCQTLNLFEIAISYRKERFISNDIFATWVSWFHELGTSSAFKGHWPILRFHYVAELGKIMDAAGQSVPLQQENDQRYLESLREFHAKVAEIMDDPGIMDHFHRSFSQQEKTLNTSAKHRSPLKPIVWLVVTVIVLVGLVWLLVDQLP